MTLYLIVQTYIGESGETLPADRHGSSSVIGHTAAHLALLGHSRAHQSFNDHLEKPLLVPHPAMGESGGIEDGAVGVQGQSRAAVSGWGHVVIQVGVVGV